MDTSRAQQCLVLFKNKSYDEAFENTLKIFSEYDLNLTECDRQKGLISGTLPINPPFENLHLSAHFFKGNETTLVGMKGKMDTIDPNSRKLGRWMRKVYFDLKDLSELE